MGNDPIGDYFPNGNFTLSREHIAVAMGAIHVRKEDFTAKAFEAYRKGDKSAAMNLFDNAGKLDVVWHRLNDSISA